MLSSVGNRFERAGLATPLLLAAVSALVLAAVLASQYVGGGRPCVLCITQRYPYVIAIVLGAVSALFYSNVMVRVLLMAVMTIGFLYGAGVGVFHSLVQIGLLASETNCGATVISSDRWQDAFSAPELAADIRCAEAAWSLFGLSMPAYNVLVSAGLAAISGLATWFGFSREA